MNSSAALPEKVLQFGTGILLRGLPDYFIDKANRLGVFEGRIVVVKSTPGTVSDFEKQNSRYTICVRGMTEGKSIEVDSTNSSISRVISAREHWPEIVKIAARPEVQLIISNTTEVGIAFEAESITQNPPNSFPAKLTAALHHRFLALGNASPLMVVVPTELVPDNGKVLKEIVLKLAEHNQLGNDFVAWLSTNTEFCNSLVDRIVTRLSDTVKKTLSVDDPLAIQVEPYKLWAIEGPDHLKNVLTFASTDSAVIIAPSIEHYRERKLRLLNGAGTFMACLGFLLGRDSVIQCMEDKSLSSFIETLMLGEIQPTLPAATGIDTRQFALDVLERWRNRYTVHRLLSITLQATAKMKMRNIPTFIRHVEQFKTIPDRMTRGFAAHLLFMKVTHQEGNHYFGRRQGEPYLIDDDQAPFFQREWKDIQVSDLNSLKTFVVKTCQNVDLWGKDMTQLPMFAETVTTHLNDLIRITGA